jgi:hypothetical protein
MPGVDDRARPSPGLASATERRSADEPEHEGTHRAAEAGIRPTSERAPSHLGKLSGVSAAENADEK